MLYCLQNWFQAIHTHHINLFIPTIPLECWYWITRLCKRAPIPHRTSLRHVIGWAEASVLGFYQTTRLGSVPVSARKAHCALKPGPGCRYYAITTSPFSRGSPMKVRFLAVIRSNRTKPFLSWSHRVTNLNRMNPWIDEDTTEENCLVLLHNITSVYNPHYLWSNPKQTQLIPQAFKRRGAQEINQENLPLT